MNLLFLRSPVQFLVLYALVSLTFLSSAVAQSIRPGMGSTPYADASGTGVTFRVWAPNATSVAVRGSFNGYSSTANFLIKEAGGLGLWSGDIPTARAGDQYKYYLSGSLWKRDPRGRKVVNSSDNTIVYDPNAFNWASDARLPVNTSNLVIYEMHVGAFYDPTPASGGPGKFADAITKLDHLAELGINAVELMPVMEFAGDNSWGYNPADPYAVENTGYGGPDGLKSFVKAAHQRGIRVLLDVVHNHYGPSDLDLWTFDNGASPSIYFYTAANICCTQWGGRPNYSTEGVRSFIIGSFRQWLDEYHVDGFRWDAVGAMRYYDPGHVGIPEADSLIQYINSTAIHSDHPGAISIAEDQSSGMNFDGEWNRSFGDLLIGEMVKSTDSSRDVVGLFNGMNASGFSRVLYDESHDLVGNLNGAGAQRLPYRIQSTDPTGYFARKRSMLAAAVVLTTPGIPMLFMGQEMLETQQFGDSNPLHWENTTNYPTVVQFYRDLIHLRRNLDGVSLGLTGPNITSHVVDNTAKLLAFHRWGAGPNDQVMIVMNFSNKVLTNYSITGFPANGTWYVNLNSDWTLYGNDFGNMGSSLIQVSAGNGQITIGPYSVQVLSRQALPLLDSDGDGLLNGWEQLHFGDPISAVASADDDGDGVDNLHEQAADTDPKSANSVLKFTGIQAGNGQITLTWKGGQSVRQVLKQASQLNGPWNAIYTNNPPTAITNTFTVPMPPSSSSIFRIELAP
ncbi:alpha-amylase family glycosyl hydrolase [Pedosphaera parvula]|nr:alpha-amylase family glycosyl hydrolase [Pedosphaera parvula]